MIHIYKRLIESDTVCHDTGGEVTQLSSIKRRHSKKKGIITIINRQWVQLTLKKERNTWESEQAKRTKERKVEKAPLITGGPISLSAHLALSSLDPFTCTWNNTVMDIHSTMNY